MKVTLRIMLCLSIILNGVRLGESLGVSLKSLSVKVGEDATLNCPLSTNCSMATVSWYKQSQGERPELVLSYHLTNTSHVLYGHGFHPNKITVQTNDSRPLHQHQLLIHGSKENDMAVYFCGLTEGFERTTDL
ncbi:secreted immunoglobulin domain 1 [Oncorhynchus mykiss]|uniref:secreted immunoglobulin domain 1 n=1 Tax=Oncorhynchus mykiss TaxID=8022 RepID=UPI0018777760|nr:secreted immunoglobulin domain 1 [Oncorhynchus mykiss]